MEDKIIEVFKKYSKSVDTECNACNCLIEEDWSNISQAIVKVLPQADVIKSACEHDLLPFSDGWHICQKCDECIKVFEQTVL